MAPEPNRIGGYLAHRLKFPIYVCAMGLSSGPIALGMHGKRLQESGKKKNSSRLICLHSEMYMVRSELR